MADLDSYWTQIKSSEKFQDLEPDKKEQVRQHLFNQYVQTAPSYSSLPQSQRLKVKSHFDDVTKIEPDSMAQSLMKTGKKVVEAVRPVVKKAGEVIAGAVDLTKLPGELGTMADTGEPIPGAERLDLSFRRAGAAGSEKLMPAEKQYALQEKIKQEPSAVLEPLTQFDLARAAAAGGIQTIGDTLADIVPKTTMGAAALFTPVDALMKYAGTTFLGREITLPWKKAKSGLSSLSNDQGDILEKLITQERVNQAGRAGNPRPLEVLANEEEKLKAQNELASYDEWLQQADQTTASPGVPTGDIYPAAKVNISQLRDAAKDRLQKLQDEPVRVESLSRAQDELQGYYRRKIDQARVYMMPEGVPRETRAMLPEGPKPAGLLEAGKQPKKSVPARSAAPVSAKPPISTPGSMAAPAESSVVTAKEVLTEAYSALHPEQTKQAIAVRVGAAMKALQNDVGMDVKNPLRRRDIDIIGKLLEQENADLAAKLETPKARTAGPSKASEIERLKEKGLDHIEVQTEAKRLQSEHETMREITDYEDAIRANGGIAMNPADPTGRIPEQEEYLRNVPIHLRGKTTPDQMAQALFDAGLQEDASSSTMYRKLSERKTVGQPRSIKSFMDEAEYRLEMQKQRDAGFKSTPKQETLPGTPGAEMPKIGLGGAEGQVPPDELLEGFKNQDIQQKSLFDVVSDIGEEGLRKLKGEGGGFNTEDFDPMKQATLEANIRELVTRARALGYETTQDIMLYAARSAPKELQDAIRKNLAPTLSAFDTHAYKEMDEARKGNPIAKKNMMDQAQRGYFQKKADIVKGVYKKFKANQQVVLFKDMDEGLMRLENDLFIHDNYRKFSKDELAAQRWYLEGKAPKMESLTALGVKEEDAKRWLELARNPTENMKNAKAMTQIFEDEYHDLISEFYDKVGYVNDHVTRRWKQAREYLDWEGRTLNNRPNFLKGRKLLTQADGINAGYEPVSFDIREDLRASNNTRVNILSRIHAYQKLGASFGEKGGPAIIDESKDAITQAKNAKITPHTGEAPNSWIRFDHVPLLKGLAFDPYYKPALKFMMTKRFTGMTPEVLDFLSASTKATKLYGFFHGYTLGEMAATGISYRDVFSFSKDRNPLFRGLRYLVKGMTADLEGEPLKWGSLKEGAASIGKLYDSFMSGSGALANRPLALDMAEHGFKFGSADEDMHGILKKYLIKTENYLKDRIGEKATKSITSMPRLAVDLQEKALWSYIRPISSMLVYETNLKDAILKFNLEAAEGKKIPIDALKQAISNQTSKEMGGISYARLMIDPRTQQVLQWAMLAPGWTIGRALMGASVLERGPEGRQARKQMAKLFVGWFFASNMINYAQTKKYFGKGRYMWDNPEGYRNQAFLSKDKDGTKYMQLSKALTEIYDDLTHPARTAAYKLSAPVQAATKLINWATMRAYYPGIEPENPLKTALHMYEPMITSGQSAYGGLPVRRGPSRNKVEAVLDEFYQGGMKNPALFQEAMQTATEEGYDVRKLDAAVRANKTRKQNREMFK